MNVAGAHPLTRSLDDVLRSADLEELRTRRPRDRDEYLALLNAHFNLKIVPDFPLKVTLEASSACNYHCPLCTREHLRRPLRHLSLETARAVIEECRRHHVHYLAFQRHGEPLLNPDLVPMMASAADAGIPVRSVITNGALLTPPMAERLLETGRPSSVIVSFDGVSPGEYRELRGTDNHELVRRHIHALHELRLQLGSPVFLQINALTRITDPARHEEFREEFSFLDNVDISTPEAIGPVDDVHDHSPVPAGPCKQLWMHLIVLSNGTVSLCCPDVNGEIRAGTFPDQSLRELWTGPAATRLRHLHIFGRRHEIPLCARCHNECAALGYG